MKTTSNDSLREQIIELVKRGGNQKGMKRVRILRERRWDLVGKEKKRMSNQLEARLGSAREEVGGWGGR